MMDLLFIIIGFFCAEGIYAAITGRSTFRKRRHQALYEDVKERAKRLSSTMDHIRDTDSHLYYQGTRDSRTSKKILRELSDGRMRRD